MLSIVLVLAVTTLSSSQAVKMFGGGPLPADGICSAASSSVLARAAAVADQITQSAAARRPEELQRQRQDIDMLLDPWTPVLGNGIVPLGPSMPIGKRMDDQFRDHMESATRSTGQELPKDFFTAPAMPSMMSTQTDVVPTTYGGASIFGPQVPPPLDLSESIGSMEPAWARATNDVVMERAFHGDPVSQDALRGSSSDFPNDVGPRGFPRGPPTQLLSLRRSVAARPSSSEGLPTPPLSSRPRRRSLPRPRSHCLSGPDVVLVLRWSGILCHSRAVHPPSVGVVSRIIHPPSVGVVDRGHHYRTGGVPPRHS